jgi:phosphoserine aminotransferase
MLAFLKLFSLGSTIHNNNGMKSKNVLNFFYNHSQKHGSINNKFYPFKEEKEEQILNRTYNFNAGPSTLPLPVLEKAQKELLNYRQTGMSVMELSHRSKEYEEIHENAKSLLKELMEIPDQYEVLFLQGGASLQFAMVPMNLLKENQTANYVLTGVWSEKALKEAEKIGQTAIAGSSKETNYTYIPQPHEIQLTDDAAYLHLTSNNTIYGTQWHHFPTFENIDVVVDMSSDILSRKVNVSQFSLIYAGAQKNLGPAGVTVVILKKDLAERAPGHIPTMLKYETHLKKNSLYNTPPTFAIYMLSLVLEWVKEQGGVESIEKRNHQKAKIIYDCIDESSGFYQPHAEKNSRSFMNITFRLPTEELTQKFVMESKERGFVGLSGHRSVGGCRASIYNAVSLEACEALADFMKEFKKRNH